MVKQEIVKLNLAIKRFKNEIALKYDVELTIISKLLDGKALKPTLNQIKNGCIIAMHEIYPESIGIKDLNSKTREKFYPMVRQVYGYLGWQHGYSYAAIGSVINKDHSTIVYSKKKVEDMLSINDKDFLKIYNTANNLIQEKYVGTISKNASR